MRIKEDILNYLMYLKKYKWVILSLYLFIEAYIIFLIGTKFVFMTISSVFVTLFVLCTLVLLFMDFNYALLVYMFSMPVLPMVLYLLYRLNAEWLGNLVAVLYFVIFMFNVYRKWKSGGFNFENISFRGKYKYIGIMYVVLFLLGCTSVLNSINKAEAGMLFFLGFVTTIVYSIVLLCYKDFNTNFVRKIILYLTIGIVISGVPDAIVSVYYIITKNANQHLYGVLGSNFMLGYTIILLPSLLYSALSSDNKEDKIVYRLLSLIEIFILSTQMSRGILLTLIFCFLALISLDKKNWYKYILVGFVIIFCVRFNVMNRWELSDLTSEINSSGLKSTVVHEITNKNALIKFVLKQSGTRRDIWGIAFAMINDHPVLGVGPGHFKYNYIPYGGEIKRSYADSHNIILNVATELGIPFTLILFFSILIVVIKTYIYGLKTQNLFIKQSLLLLGLGIISLLIYGNITGQAFMTFVYPISTVPAFVFTVVITLMIILYKYEYR
jgi:O-antigen ligase